MLRKRAARAVGDELAAKREMAGGARSVYAAMYEFHQGSEPLMLWSTGACEGVTEDAFKWAIVSAPAVPEDAGLCPPVSRVVSQLNKMWYVAFHSAVPDVDARGFSRIVSLAVGHTSKELVHASQCSPVLDRCEEVLLGMQERAMNKFRRECGVRYWELTQVLEKHPNLEQKAAEMKALMDKWGIVPVVGSAEGIDVQKFSDINNDLRSMMELVELDCGGLEKVVGMFARDEKASLVRARGSCQKTMLSLDFGGSVSRYSDVWARLFNKGAEMSGDRFRLIDFVEDRIFSHMIFSLFGGATLVVKSQTLFEKAVRFGEKMCLFVPMFEEEWLHVCDEIDVGDCFQYSIVVTKKLMNLTIDHDLIALLDFDKNFYRGPICPESSSVEAIFGSLYGAPSEFSFLMLAMDRLAEIDNTMARTIVKWLDNTPTSFNGIRGVKETLPEPFFGQHELHIIKYLVYSQLNATTSRVIPAVSNSSVDIGFVVHHM